ncbi:MAG: hypothetical protein KKC11_03955 [Candidatus Omnitrophica bacterium]|nr:hypothetical protein [Candidatus Omnitrophota bacterium]
MLRSGVRLPLPAVKLVYLAFIVFMFFSSYLAEKIPPFTIIISVGIIITLFSLCNLLRDESK